MVFSLVPRSLGPSIPSHTRSKWRSIQPLDAELGDPAAPVIPQQAVTADGYYDLWILWNQNGSDSVDTSLKLDDPISAAYAVDVVSGDKLKITRNDRGGVVGGVHLDPLQTRMWYDTVSNWFRSKVQTPEGQLPKPEHPHTLFLRDGWAMHRVPGSTHEVAVEMRGQTSLMGSRGSSWLTYRPQAEQSIDLSGTWQASDDAMKFDRDMKLPGDWNAYTARRTFAFGPELKGRRAVLSIVSDGQILSAVINGHFVRGLHHRIDRRVDLDITPWVKPGERNTIVLGRWHESGKASVDRIAVDLFDPEVYP